ncbi:MAG: TPM domain-containing protein [Chitinophagaceae bacterium]|nr:TPM domain-containing protein [Chitinophagaceae bacterium]
MRKINKGFFFLMLLAIYSCNSQEEKHREAFISPAYMLNDYSGFLTAKEQDSLLVLLKRITEKRGMSIVIYSTDNFEQRSVDSLSKMVFGNYFPDHDIADKACLFFLSKATREVRLELGNDIGKIISDSMAAEILNSKVIPYFKENLFLAGIISGVSEIDNILPPK